MSTDEVPAAVEEVLSSIGSSALVAHADDDDQPELDEKLSSKHGDLKSERAIAAARWVDKEVGWVGGWVVGGGWMVGRWCVVRVE